MVRIPQARALVDALASLPANERDRLRRSEVKLIVSELVTNAIQHGDGTRVAFTMTVRDGFLRLAVHGETPGRPVVRAVDDAAEHGRGLFLVDRLATAHDGTWGTSDDGTTTWCSLAVPGGRP
ncbi:ATP-binding protein [Streptomyces sp. NPDC005009]